METDSTAESASAKVANAFESMKSVRETLARMAKVVEPMGRLSQFADLFEPIRTFQEQLTEAVAVLAAMKGFREHLENLTTRFEQMRSLCSQFEKVTGTFHERLVELGATTQPAAALNNARFAEILEPIKKIQEGLAEVASALEPIRGFRSHLDNVANRLKQMRPSQTELEQVTAGFRGQLVQLAEAMQPAAAVRDQLEDLLKAFEPAKALQRRFVDLSRAFGDRGGDDSNTNTDSSTRS
jgi:DNA repair ATPase RecN